MIYFITKQKSIDHPTDIIIDYDIRNLLKWSKDKVVVQVDTETEGFFDHKNSVLTLQIGDANDQFVIKVDELNATEKNAITEHILANPRITKVLHNAKFDIKFLWRSGFDIRNVYDTMVVEQILNAGKFTDEGFYSLYGLCRRYLDIELDKSIRGTIQIEGLTDRVIRYAAADVQHLERIMQLQKSRVSDLKLGKIVDIELDFIEALSHMEYVGVRVDPAIWQDVRSDVYKALVDVEDELILELEKDHRTERFVDLYQDLFSPSKKRVAINLASPPQKLKLLQTLFPEITSTGKNVISKYEKKHPIVSKLVEYNTVNKLRTAFADKLLTHVNSRTGRIHPEYKQILNTGRISCKNPNLQQIPSRTELGGSMRKAFKPAPGYKYAGGDYSGMELRIIAQLSKDPVWVEAFQQGQDLHGVLCSKTFDIPLSDVRTVSPYGGIKYRDIQKTINFGLAYGASAHKLASIMQISVPDAQKIIDNFFSIVPQVQHFLTVMGTVAKTYGFIKTPFGRIRWFENYDNKDDFKRQGSIERQGKNHPIQGCNADITKLAICRLYDYIRSNNYWNPVTRINECSIVLQVHDEIIIETINPERDAPVLQEIMISAGKEVLTDVPCIVDVGISDYWTK